MNDDRTDLLDRPADTLRDVDPETGEVRATLSYNGRTVDFSPGAIEAALASLGRERRNPPDPATRDARTEGYLGDDDPDERWDVPYDHGSVALGKRNVSMPFSQSTALADLAAALIERDPKLSPIAKWELSIVYRWGDDLGKEGNGLRLWRLKKPNPDATWALGQCRPPRACDLLLDLNALAARRAEFTGWQVQAALHEALGCIRVRPGGAFTIEQPAPDWWAEHIVRRYGLWKPSLRQWQEIMRLAEESQLPLWEDEGEGDDE